MVLAPEHLVAGAEGGDARIALLAERGREAPPPVDLHDLHGRVGLHETLAHPRILDDADLPGALDDLLQLLLEAPVAGRGRAPPLEPERRVGHLPAVVHAADDVLLRAARAVEEHLVELGGAVGLDDRPHLHSGLAHRHEQVGDALVLRRVRIGAGEQEGVVGVLGLGRPDLLAVDHPLLAVEHRRGLERGEVRARVRLAEALAPADLPREDLRQEVLLLLFRTPLEQRRADERVAEEVGPERRPHPGELLGQHDVLHGGQALAAVLLRPRRADPAALVELLRPALVEGDPLLAAQLEARLGPALGQVLVQPAPDLLPEGLGFRRVGEVHGGNYGLARRPFGSPRSTAARRWRFPRRLAGRRPLVPLTVRRWRRGWRARRARAWPASARGGRRGG